jgi:thiol-disulfide isomerase/thioredoxin
MNNPVRIAKFAVLLAAALILMWALKPETEDAPRPLTPAGQRATVPDMSFVDLNGRTWRLSDHRGQVVLLNFWATWCPPCREETPGLVRLAKEYANGGLAIMGISMDDGGAKVVRQFVSEYGIPYPVGFPPATSTLANAVQALPTTFLVDRQGRLAKTYVGEASERTFRTDIDRLLRSE